MYPWDDGFLRETVDAAVGNDAHRILRRGSAYGPLRESDPKAKRGLLFACYQIDLARQFEFIQNSWANNTDFPHSDSRFSKPDPANPLEPFPVSQHGKDLIKDKIVKTLTFAIWLKMLIRYQKRISMMILQRNRLSHLQN